MKKIVLSNNVKKMIKIVAIALCVIAVVIGASLGTYYGVVANEVTITVDDTITYQQIKGFGASSAWTFQTLGKVEDETIKDEIIEMLYGDSGMQLSIFRYNVGAGSIEVKDKNVYDDEERMSESFFISENYVDNSSFNDVSNYDFTRDKEVIDLMKKSLALGNINKVVIFANSPHYLMTESQMATGEVEYQNNLRVDSFEAFSNYMLIISNYIYENIIKPINPNIEVYISPVNEPQWRWGGQNASQEGCHYDPEHLAAFYDVFYAKTKEFNKNNNTNFVMDIFESGNYKLYHKRDVKKYLAAFSKYEWFDEIDEISVHSYGGEDYIDTKTKFANFMNKNYPDISVSVSEFCEMEWGRFDTMQSGLFLARVIARDLRIINATEWSWWLAVSSGDYNDGLVYWDHDESLTQNEISVLKRYYTMSHFSKYLQEGDVHIDTKNSDTLMWADVETCAFKREDGTKIIYLINSSTSSRKVVLNGISGSGSKIVTSENETLKEYNIQLKSGDTLQLGAESIVTLVVK